MQNSSCCIYRRKVQNLNKTEVENKIETKAENPVRKKVVGNQKYK